MPHQKNKFRKRQALVSPHFGNRENLRKQPANNVKKPNPNVSYRSNKKEGKTGKSGKQ